MFTLKIKITAATPLRWRHASAWSLKHGLVKITALAINRRWRHASAWSRDNLTRGRVKIAALALAVALFGLSSAFAAEEEQKVNPSEMQGTYLGDVVSDAMRAALGADIAFINGGSLGFESLPEKLNKENLTKLVPFSTDLVLTAKMKGAAIVSALEQSCTRLPRRSSTFLQVSGLTFTCDVNKAPGARVSDVKLGGKALEPGKEYIVASTDFILSGGGGLKAFREAEVTDDKGAAIGDILLKNAAYDGKRAASGSTRIRIIEEKKK